MHGQQNIKLGIKAFNQDILDELNIQFSLTKTVHQRKKLVQCRQMGLAM
jgi:hypothetical protein